MKPNHCVDSRHSAIQQLADGVDWTKGSMEEYERVCFGGITSRDNVIDARSALHEKEAVCQSVTEAFATLYVCSVFPPQIHSPTEAMFVRWGVFLQQRGELQEGKLLQQIHLQHRLAANLELGRGQTGSMGVLEARPAKFLWSGKLSGEVKKAQIETWEVKKKKNKIRHFTLKDLRHTSVYMENDTRHEQILRVAK